MVTGAQCSLGIPRVRAEQQWYRWNQGGITAGVTRASAAEMGDEPLLFMYMSYQPLWTPSKQAAFAISSDPCPDTALAALPFPPPFTKHRKFLLRRTAC